MSSGAFAVPRPGRTKPVSAAQVRSYAAKAEEFAEAAVSKRAAGDDHDQVLVLLRQAGADGAEVERDLRRLLPLKTKAEYDPDEIAPSVAAKAVERAQRCAVVARRVASTTRWPPSAQKRSS